MTSARQVILVTGMPRSGTTAVGEHLGHGAKTAILHEPMNRTTGLTRVRNNLEIPGAGGFSTSDLHTIMSDMQALRLTYRRTAYARDPAWRKLVARVTGSRPRITYFQARLQAATRGVDTLIWKDPIAAFCAPEVARMGWPVVVTLRPPHAIAASLKRMSWGGRYDEVADRLATVGLWPEGAPRPQAKGTPGFSPAINAALMWRAIYGQIADLIPQHPNVALVDIDQIIANPVDTYRQLYDRLGLPWGTDIETEIRRAYAPKPGNPAGSAGAATGATPKAGQAHDKTRDITQVNAYWRKILSDVEAAFVSELTDATWARLSALVAPPQGISEGRDHP